MGAAAAISLSGCAPIELSQALGSRGEYGVVLVRYEPPNWDDPATSPRWLYPDFTLPPPDRDTLADGKTIAR